MFNTSAQNLRDEIKSAIELRDDHLSHQQKLIRTFTGRYYSKKKQPDSPVTSNHPYEFLTIQQPLICHDNPRCMIRASGPLKGDDYGMTTMGQWAKVIEGAINQWAVDMEIGAVLNHLATDFCFSYGVAMMTVADQPGYQGVELVPTRPYLVHIPNTMFCWDSAAKNHDPTKTYGPRWMGHMWRADQEDLMKDPEYNSEQLAKLSVDTDLEKSDPVRKTLEIPRRREIVAWDIWVPEIMTTEDPAFNGTIYTVAIASTPEGTSKRTLEIREPRPAYCGPWGPYTIFGANRVPDSAFPLSPLVAVAEQAEQVNAHITAAAKSAASYKKFGVTDKGNAADREIIRQVRNGDIIGVQDVERIKEMEMGGVSDAQYQFIQSAREELNRASGLTEALRGMMTRGVTATDSAIADAGTQVRVAGLKRAFRRGVTQTLMSAVWFMFYGEDMIMPVTEEVSEETGIQQFQGGNGPGSGRTNWNFYDLSLDVDPFSMEHTDQAILQKRSQDMFRILLEATPIMIQTPHVDWREPIRQMLQVLNFADADQWFDWDMIKKLQAMQIMQQMPPPDPQMMAGGAPGIEGPPIMDPQSANAPPGPAAQVTQGQLADPNSVGGAPYQPHISGFRDRGALAGAAVNIG